MFQIPCRANVCNLLIFLMRNKGGGVFQNQLFVERCGRSDGGRRGRKGPHRAIDSTLSLL